MQDTLICLKVETNGRCNNAIPENAVFCADHYRQWEQGTKDDLKSLTRKFISNSK